jgi:hypothetical protein
VENCRINTITERGITIMKYEVNIRLCNTSIENSYFDKYRDAENYIKNYSIEGWNEDLKKQTRYYPICFTLSDKLGWIMKSEDNSRMIS